MGQKKERPLSPHLTIYRPQITSVLSISHRATGVFLFLGSFVLIWGMVLDIYGCDCIFPLFHTSIGQLALFAWSFFLFYHLCNGIRHLFWDAGKGFEIHQVTASGILVLFASTILTLISWAIAFHYIEVIL